MILVDTSVWIAFLRKGSNSSWKATLARAIADDEVVTVEPILAELLYGVRSERERQVVLDIASAVRSIPLARAHWIAAGDLGRRWRGKGRTLSLVDALLAAAAAAEGLALWTLDGDFEPLFEAAEVRRFQP